MAVAFAYVWIDMPRQGLTKYGMGASGEGHHLLPGRVRAAAEALVRDNPGARVVAAARAVFNDPQLPEHPPPLPPA